MPNRTTDGPAPTADPVVADGRFNRFLERTAREVVGATYWFTPATDAPRGSVTLRFTGRRLDVEGALAPGDQFVQDELINDVLPGSGPVAITAKIRNVNSGSWEVRAKMLPPARTAQRRQGRKAEPASGPVPVYPARWSWRHWRLTSGEVGPVSTCPAPLVRAPATIIGAWPILTLLGIAAALVT